MNLLTYLRLGCIALILAVVYNVTAERATYTKDLMARSPPDSLAKSLYRQGIDPEDAYRWATYFVYYADQTGTDPFELAAIAALESNWNPKAHNPADPSYGLMAVMPKYWENTFVSQCGEKADPDALMDPRVAICYGAYIRKHFHSLFPDTMASLRAYNNGGGWESVYDDLVLQRKAQLK